jgi:hypothetical protein
MKAAMNHDRTSSNFRYNIISHGYKINLKNRSNVTCDNYDHMIGEERRLARFLLAKNHIAGNGSEDVLTVPDQGGATGKIRGSHYPQFRPIITRGVCKDP